VAEAHAVAAQAKRLLAEGVPASQIAVLFRINAQSETVEEALAELDVPYVVRGAERFFRRPEVRQAVTLLRGAARAGSDDDVAAVLAGMGWGPEPPAGRGSQRDAWESLRVLVDLCSQIRAEGIATDLTGIVAELDRRAEEQHAPVADGVTVATLHTAKGLEWDAVFLAGVHEGALPIVYAETPEAVEEERRLLYVGMTRARTRLWVTWSRARTPGGRGQRGPSRFLDAVPEVRREPAPPRGEPRGRRRAKVKRCRVCDGPLSAAAEVKLGRHTDCEVPYDEALLEALKEWRLQRARSDSVPAYVVFTDTTLQALAEQRPVSDRDLLKISGIGPSKMDKYGGEVLELLRSF
jgi:DNA helicase-2/ATP-dependent DNA helicase PcrA